jgi:hypothetical protein
VALVVCVVVLSVVAQTLIASLRAEDAAARLREGNLLCDRLVAARRCDIPMTNVMASAGSAWTFDETEIQDGDLRWRVWSVSPADRPSLIVSTAFRESSAR